MSKLPQTMTADMGVGESKTWVNPPWTMLTHFGGLSILEHTDDNYRLVYDLENHDIEIKVTRKRPAIEDGRLFSWDGVLYTKVNGEWYAIAIEPDDKWEPIGVTDEFVRENHIELVAKESHDG